MSPAQSPVDPADRLPDTEVVADGLSFPEALRWHDGRLWLSDIHGHRVVQLDGHGAVRTVAALRDRPSGLGFRPDGTPLVVSMLDRHVLLIKGDGTTALHADLSPFCSDFLNDMVVDRQGRAYVGARNRHDGGPRNDCLVLVDPTGEAQVAAEELESPNGAVITPDGRTLIVAETSAGRLTAFDIKHDGTLGNRRTFAEFPGFHFDGICLDPHGDVWIGGGIGGLLRVAGEGRAATLHQIETPQRMVLDCVFGGEGGRDLFVATTGQQLIENLREVGADRSRDRHVHSDGRVLRVSPPGRS